MLADEVTFDRLLENVGSLAISSLCHDFSAPVRKYNDISIIDAVLSGVISPANLERIKIQRLDAREAELEQVQFIDCEVVQLTVDETTLFGSSHPRVHNLLLSTESGHIEEIFDPSVIASWIDKHSTAPEKPGETAPGNQEAVRLFERVCRVMLRQHMIKEHPSDAAGRLLQQPYWKDIEDILFRAKFLDRIKGKGTGGPAASFLRMKDPMAMLISGDSSVTRIWDEVGAIPIR